MIHTVDLLWQKGVPPPFIDAAERAANDTLQSAGFGQVLCLQRLDSCLGVREIGVEQELAGARQFALVNWKIRDRLNPNQLGRFLYSRPWRSKGDRGFSLLIVRDDFVVDADGSYLYGSGDEGFAAVSIHRFQNERGVNDPLRTFATIVTHELGHAFGAPASGHRQAVEQNYGAHCTNRCVMRQRGTLSQWERDISPAIAAGEVFCPLCRADIAVFVPNHLAAK